MPPHESLALDHIALCPEETLEILRKAEILQEIDCTALAKKELEQEISHTSVSGYISRDALISLAENLQINREYVERVLQQQSLSYLQKRKDIEEVGAKPSITVLLQHYQNHFLRELRIQSPLEQYRCEIAPTRYITGGHTASFFQVGKQYLKEYKEHKTSWIFWTKTNIIQKIEKKEDEKLAEMAIRNYTLGPRFSLNLDVYSPMFLHICKGALRSLNEKYKGLLADVDIKHHYMI